MKLELGKSASQVTKFLGGGEVRLVLECDILFPLVTVYCKRYIVICKLLTFQSTLYIFALLPVNCPGLHEAAHQEHQQGRLYGVQVSASCHCHLYNL